MLLVDDINDLQLQIKEWSDSDNRAKKHLLSRIGAAGCVPLELLILTLTPIQLLASIGGNALKGGVKLIRLAAPNSPALKKCDDALPGPIDFWNSLKKTASIAAGFFISLFVGIFHPMTSYAIHKKLNLVEEPKKEEKKDEAPIKPKIGPPKQPPVPPKPPEQPPIPPKSPTLPQGEDPEPPVPPKDNSLNPPAPPALDPNKDHQHPSSPISVPVNDPQASQPALPSTPPPSKPPILTTNPPASIKHKHHHHHHHHKKSSKKKIEQDRVIDVRDVKSPRKKRHHSKHRLPRHRSVDNLAEMSRLDEGEIIGELLPVTESSSQPQKNVQDLNVLLTSEPPKSHANQSKRFSLSLPRSVSNFFKRQSGEYEAVHPKEVPHSVRFKDTQ